MDTAGGRRRKETSLVSNKALTAPLKGSQFAVPGCLLRKARCMKWLAMNIAHPALSSIYGKCASSKSLGCGTSLS